MSFWLVKKLSMIQSSIDNKQEGAMFGVSNIPICSFSVLSTLWMRLEDNNIIAKILISASCGICQLLITTIINYVPCKKSHQTKFTKFLLSGHFIQKGLRATYWLSRAILSFKCFCVCVCSLKIFQWPEVSYSHSVFKRKETSVELN